MQAVRDDYEPRSMQALCQEALQLLRKQAPGRLSHCAHIGEQLFFSARHRGSCPFARIAGKVMKRLKDAGLAKRDMQRVAGRMTYGWVVTAAGRETDYQ